MNQLKNDNIILRTETSLLINTYDEKENHFFILNSIDLNNNLLLISPFR